MSGMNLILDTDCKLSSGQFQMIPSDLKSRISTCHVNGLENQVIMGEVVKPCSTEITEQVEYTPAWYMNGELRYGIMTVDDIDMQMKK